MPEALGESLIAFGRTEQGIPFGGPRRQLTNMFFLVLARDSHTHLKILARIGRLVQVDGFTDTLSAAESPEEAYDCIIAADLALGE